MRILGLDRCTFTISAAAALLQGCGGPQQTIGAPGALQQGGVVATHGYRSGSWMLPEAKSAAQLLYVVESQTNEVAVLKLPQGKRAGLLTGFYGPLGACTDTKGNVFITDDRDNQIWEYSHGARSPKAILNDPNYGPVACSVDPTTGNLAVANGFKSSGTSGPGNIALYKRETGKPKLYFDSSIFYVASCTYDDKGDLYTGGVSSSNQSAFAKLLKGKSKFNALTLKGDINGMSFMEWDGEDLAIGDGGSLIYRFQIKGTTGTEVGILKMRGVSDVADFAINDGLLYAPAYSASKVAAYAYPHGGKAINMYLGFAGPIAVTVSVMPTKDPE